MAIIVFGGNGFVGSNLVDALIKLEKEVIVCDIVKCDNSKKLDNVTYVTLDMTKKSDFEKLVLKSDDIVVNLAANQYHNKVPRKGRKEYFFDTNTAGTRNILEYMENCDCKNFCMFTTDMTYGRPQYLPVDTNHPQKPFGFYGQSKKAAEDICKEYRKKEFNITIFRPRMIIGPGRLGILKKLFWLIKHNLPVPTIGSGKNCYQMISVFDCVSAIMCAIDKGLPNSEYNLGSKNAPSTKDLLMNLAKSVGSKTIVFPTCGPLVKFVLKIMSIVGLEIMYKEQYMIADEDYILDISKTEEELDWEPQYSDKDMIVEAFNNYNK
ncbi:MAG: NAD(P)-dependent oxidoreductase [Lachnospiraceae bacterium]|nr:NAD(P)-dependent oxidoreductase [Lachnospiraceae bacterium]